MKLYKYTFISPVCGSIECEELFPDSDGRYELSPEQMSDLYDQDESLLMFLTENSEDLSFYAPEELKDIIFRAEFGDCDLSGCGMHLRTHIWVMEHLTEEGIEKLQHWIAGQLSDGWGEGLEQRNWRHDRVRKPIMHFDEYYLEFEENYEMCDVYYYVNPWNAREFDVILETCEEVDAEAEISVVGTTMLPGHTRQVIRVQNGIHLRMFLKDCGQEELASEIERSFAPTVFDAYIVRDLDANSEEQILHKWACGDDTICTLFDRTRDDDHTITYNMAVSNAVPELLK